MLGLEMPGSEPNGPATFTLNPWYTGSSRCQQDDRRGSLPQLVVGWTAFWRDSWQWASERREKSGSQGPGVGTGEPAFSGDRVRVLPDEGVRDVAGGDGHTAVRPYPVPRSCALTDGQDGQVDVTRISPR